MNLLVLAISLTLGFCGFSQQTGEHVEISVTDSAGQPLPCRVHLRDSNGKAQAANGLPFWRDHFVCPGNASLQLKPGDYAFEIERGPEYESIAGNMTVTAGQASRLARQLNRVAHLSREGWWGGEMHVHRPLEDIELLMRAEDLHVAPVITWWNRRNQWSERGPPERLLRMFDTDRYYHVMAGEDEREGGALLYFHLSRPLPIADSSREYPSPMHFLEMARRQNGAWVDVEKPFWWDVPVWLAGGQVQSIGLANNHMCRSQMYETEAWGKPRDASRLAAPLGNGFWSQEIYYHVLNCGLRVPPSAGSASGVLPNPVGYNRIYAFVPGAFSYDRWWLAVREGQTFVTNGPLLRVRANGQLPGHVFAIDGDSQRVQFEVTLTSRDPIRTIELIHNGQVQRSVTGAEWAQNAGVSELEIRDSGWFLIRVIAENSRTFRFASTAPFYVERGDEKRRVSRRSAQFFLDWVNERIERIRVDDPDQYRDVLSYHVEARKFWQQRVMMANAD